MPTARTLLKKFEGTKIISPVAGRLNKLLSDENSTMHEFEKVLQMDPTLVASLLRLVNSSLYGLRREVVSISTALVFVGMKNLRNMIMTTSMKNVFTENPRDGAFSRAQLGLHCAAVGICAKLISERIFGKNGEDAFLCGILHDIGMIVEAQEAQELFLQVSDAYDPDSQQFIEQEKAIMGTDHCELGFLLAGEWNLPVDVQQGIRYHHDPGKESAPSDILGIIRIAHSLVAKFGYTATPEVTANLSPGLTAYLRENIEEYRVLVKGLPDELAKAKDIYEPHGE